MSAYLIVSIDVYRVIGPEYTQVRERVVREFGGSSCVENLLRFIAETKDGLGPHDFAGEPVLSVDWREVSGDVQGD